MIYVKHDLRNVQTEKYLCNYGPRLDLARNVLSLLSRKSYGIRSHVESMNLALNTLF